MFQFSAFAPLRVTGLQPAGFPHSEMYGSKDICSSPYLIAAYHVLLRLSKPRHPLCALSNLSNSYVKLFMIYYFNQFQYVNELCQSHRMAKTIQLNLTSGG
jgi:uncharacterized membrane protein